MLAAVLALLAIGLGLWAVLSDDDDEPEVETKVVTVEVETDDAADAPVGPLGFPLVATRNTTRVGGPDPASDAAAIALATHPPSGLAPKVARGRARRRRVALRGNRGLGARRTAASRPASHRRGRQRSRTQLRTPSRS